MSRYSKDEETTSSPLILFINKSEATHFGDIPATNWEEEIKD